jgi:hypothetical protein
MALVDQIDKLACGTGDALVRDNKHTNWLG